MGYDIRLVAVNEGAHIKEGAMVSDLPIGGQAQVHLENHPLTVNDLYFYCTFNYSWYFGEAFEGVDGLKGLDGKTTDEAIPILEAARPKIAEMEEAERKTKRVLSQTWGNGQDYDDSDTNYWSISAKNAGIAVDKLIQYFKLAPGYTISIFA